MSIKILILFSSFLFSLLSIGSSDSKCSIILLNNSGFRGCQSVSTDLVTVIKSFPIKTPTTPFVWNNLSARGESLAFFLSLKERLQRMGINTDSPDGVHNVCWHSGPAVECDLVIRPSTSNPYPCEVHCELVLHDLYIPSGSGGWGPKEIEHQILWLNDPIGERPQGEARYWIHVRDVVDMISVLFANLPNGVIDVSGRRCWSHEAMSSELEMLFKRVKAAESKTFQLDNLKIFEKNLAIFVGRFWACSPK